MACAAGYAASMTDRIPLEAPGLSLGDVSLSHPVPADEAGLRAAANSEETWKWYTYRADGAHFDKLFWRYFLEHHQPPKEVHHVVRYQGKIVGATCYLAADNHHKRVEIGGTWYHDSVRGTRVNPTCKLLLIQRAFDWGAQRVELKTDSNNARSRAAIEKLGFAYDGTLRNHMFLHDGRVRDTVYYSMVPEEWPAAKKKLEARLGL